MLPLGYAVELRQFLASVKCPAVLRISPGWMVLERTLISEGQWRRTRRLRPSVVGQRNCASRGSAGRDGIVVACTRGSKSSEAIKWKKDARAMKLTFVACSSGLVQGRGHVKNVPENVTRSASVSARNPWARQGERNKKVEKCKFPQTLSRRSTYLCQRSRSCTAYLRRWFAVVVARS